MEANDQLLKKHFRVKSFDEAINKVSNKEAAFFSDNLFMEKNEFIAKLKTLANGIESLASTYKMAQEASKSGSIIQNLASAGFGSIQQEYIQKLKALVHHFSLFLKKK